MTAYLAQQFHKIIPIHLNLYIALTTDLSHMCKHKKKKNSLYCSFGGAKLQTLEHGLKS